MTNLIKRTTQLLGVATIALVATAPAFAQEAIETENPYGLMAALEQGGIIAQVIFGIMVLMSVVSWYIMFTKWFEQKKMLSEAVEVEKKVWSASSLKEGASKLDKSSAFRQLADDGLRAFDHHEGKLTDQIDQNEWVTMTLNRSAGLISTKLNSGLSFLASVGATAPFIGLFGTVWGIMNSFIGISKSQTTNLAVVAPGIAEALLATAIGLVAAIPAVIIYNHFSREIKVYLELVARASGAAGRLLSRDLDRSHGSAHRARAAE